MTRLANKGSALSTIGLALALFGGLMLGGAQVASAQVAGEHHDFLTGYFLRTTGGSDDVLTLTNGTGEYPAENLTPGLTSADTEVPICANIYVYDPVQEEEGCCEVQISAGGMARLPINELVADLTLPRSPVPTTGIIRVVATNADTSIKFVPTGIDSEVAPSMTSLGCNAQHLNVDVLAGWDDVADTTFRTERALHGWITHTYQGVTVAGTTTTTFTSELPLSDTHQESTAAELNQEFAGKCTNHPATGNCCTLPGFTAGNSSCS